MSIHGICFDNGMSGNCNVECEILADCDERLNIIDDAILNGYTADDLLDLEVFDNDLEMYKCGIFHEYLLNKYIGEFRRAVLKAQNKFEFNEYDFLEKQLADNSEESDK